MFSWLANAWRVPELRRRVLFTGLILGLYRLGSWMPAPGVDSKSIQDFFGSGGRGSSILGLPNLFSGSALSRVSIFALGIMPYVTASIILQVLTVVIPKLEELQKEGEAGMAKINQYTRYLTVILAAAQSTGYAYLFKRQGALTANPGRLVLIIITLTAGCTLLMWLGELITKRGVGNGISLLIFASILSSAPTGVAAWYNGGTMERLFFPLVALAIIAAVVFIQEGQRRIPIQYAKRMVGRRQSGGYIPGIRPGAPTAQYLDRVLTRLTLPGSLYLALVAVLPSVFIRYGGFSQATSRALGGTSVLIVVGVALDTMRQMESQMMMRSYEGFLR